VDWNLRRVLLSFIHSLIDWLIDCFYLFIMMGWDYVSELRPPTGLLFIPSVMCEHGEPWWWWCRLGITPNSSTRALWQSYQQRSLGASRRNGRRSANFAYQYLKYLKGPLTCRKVLRHGTFGFTSHPKEDVLRICIASKNLSSRPGIEPRSPGLPVRSQTLYWLSYPATYWLRFYEKRFTNLCC
jgi:hypothetical protein